MHMKRKYFFVVLNESKHGGKTVAAEVMPVVAVLTTVLLLFGESLHARVGPQKIILVLPTSYSEEKSVAI